MLAYLRYVNMLIPTWICQSQHEHVQPNPWAQCKCLNMFSHTHPPLCTAIDTLGLSLPTYPTTMLAQWHLTLDKHGTHDDLPMPTPIAYAYEVVTILWLCLLLLPFNAQQTWCNCSQWLLFQEAHASLGQHRLWRFALPLAHPTLDLFKNLEVMPVMSDLS